MFLGSVVFPAGLDDYLQWVFPGLINGLRLE